MLSMAAPMHMLADANERELYNSVHNATKEAEIEGDARLQAAVAAARAPLLPHNSDRLVRLNTWSLMFNNARLEAAFFWKMNTNCDATCSSHDYIPVILKLALAVPDLVWALTSFCKSQPEGLAEQPWAASASHLWCLLVALVCGVFLAVQLRALKWYRSNRCRTLSWFIAALWLSESVNIFLSSQVTLWKFLFELVAPCIYMSFLLVVPFRLHLQLRTLGLAGQICAILARHDQAQAHKMLLGVTLGHLAGIGVAYYLDRSARAAFLKSLPPWLVEEVTGVGVQSASHLRYRASLSRQLWSIFYPGLVDMPAEPRKGEGSALAVLAGANPALEAAAPRRALGGFAGGFGGVSGLKGTSMTTSTYNPIPLSSPSTSSSDHDGDVDSSTSDGDWGLGRSTQNWARDTPQDPPGSGLGPRARAFPQYRHHQGSSTACSQVACGSSSWQRSWAYRGMQPDTDDGW